MNLSKTTYRFLSAFTLLLFLSSVILPVTLSAASLFCGMQQATQDGQHASTCWNMNSADQGDSFSATSTCSFQEVCDQAISDNMQHAEAIPQVTKSFAVAFVLTKMSPEITTAPQHCPPQFETPVLPKDQPLFLLNSTFLN